MNDQSQNREITVKTGDRLSATISPPTPIIIVLDKLRSAFNVGNIFRLAETTNIRKVITCHYTATPPHPKLSKTARGCEQTVPCQHFAQTVDAIIALKKEGYYIYGVETVEGATTIWDAKFKFPAAFIVGNEALGIAEEVLKLCDEFIELPCYGKKKSLNVGNCASVVLYEAIHQHQQK